MKKLSILIILALVLSFGLCSCQENNGKKNYSKANTLADFKDAKIGAQPGTVFETIASQIDTKNIELGYNEIPDLIVALKAGSIDGVICERPQAVSAANKNSELTFIDLKNNSTGFSVSEEDSGIAIGLIKGSELTDKINAILKEISTETREELMNQMVALAAGEKVDKLALEIPTVSEYKGTLKVGMECASEPWNWTCFEEQLGCVPISGEGKEGQYANGYDVIISAYVAARLGYKLEVYAYGWDNLIPAVQAKTLDVIIAGMSPTAARKEVIDFTDLYYNVNYVILVKK